MKRAARISLAIVVVAAGIGLLPSAGASENRGAVAVPTPLLSQLLGEPEPEPSNSGGGGGGGGGGEDPGGGGGSSGGGGQASGDDDETKKEREARERRERRRDKLDGRKDDKKKKRKRKNVLPPLDGTPAIPGAYSTDELLTIAGHLRSLGWSAEAVIDRVFPPFIIAGEATWIDTWGVPRYGPGPIVRRHEGQDVFCDYGDPVLAPVAGRLSMSDGGLGGITSRVHLEDGSYWYLTHLSDWNVEEFANGDLVDEGDVIGYCGNSGNAEKTPPHVHFGWYMPNGRAKNPMRQLVVWLREAEARATGLVAQVESERQKKLPILTAERRFGDAFAPDRSVLAGAAGESLWASGSAPESGALALAEAALQAALAEREFAGDAIALPPASEGAGGGASLDPASRLAQVLDRRFARTESHD
ncbi:MAG: M23 family metallopeptidase [Actinomycetota bacterium]|nr:M23 family metallopeptidase [Actinomycetota bacterium]